MNALSYLEGPVVDSPAGSHSSTVSCRKLLLKRRSSNEESSSRHEPYKNCSHVSTVVSLAIQDMDDTNDLHIDAILNRMSREKITRAWQLVYLDSAQWYMLGVPLGLVTSIKKCLSQMDQELEQELHSTYSDHRFLSDSLRSDVEEYIPPADDVVLLSFDLPAHHHPRPLPSSFSCGSITPPVMPRRQRSVGLAGNESVE